MKNFRIKKKISSPGPTPIQPSSLSNLGLWLKADAGVTYDGGNNVTLWEDQSGNGLDAIAPGNSPIYQSNQLNGYPVISFNSSWLQVPQNSIGNNGNLSLFIVIDYINGGIILNKGDGATYQGTVWEMTPQNGYGYVSNNSSWNVVNVSSHLSPGFKLLEGFTHDGISQLAINGTNIEDLSDQAENFNNISQYIGIAGGGVDGSAFSASNFKIAEIIIYDRVLTTEERQGIETYLNEKYFPSNTNTEPAIIKIKKNIPESSVVQASLLLNMNGSNGSTSFTDSSINNFSISRIGDTVISTTESKFGGSAAYFDGNGDRLTIANSPLFNFSTNDFTVEAWIYMTNIDTQNGIFGIPNGGIAIAVNSDNILIADKANVGGSPLFGSTALTNNTWYHIAITRKNGYARSFINGVLESEGSWTASLDSSATILIGEVDPGNWPFNGYIDDLRIINGTALYTSNFIPPASELTNTVDLSSPILPKAIRIKKSE